jgi:hypothetical protein
MEDLCPVIVHDDGTTERIFTHVIDIHREILKYVTPVACGILLGVSKKFHTGQEDRWRQFLQRDFPTLIENKPKEVSHITYYRHLHNARHLFDMVFRRGELPEPIPQTILTELVQKSSAQSAQYLRALYYSEYQTVTSGYTFWKLSTAKYQTVTSGYTFWNLSTAKYQTVTFWNVMNCANTAIRLKNITMLLWLTKVVYGNSVSEDALADSFRMCFEDITIEMWQVLLCDNPMTKLLLEAIFEQFVCRGTPELFLTVWPMTTTSPLGYPIIHDELDIMDVLTIVLASGHAEHKSKSLAFIKYFLSLGYAIPNNSVMSLISDRVILLDLIRSNQLVFTTRLVTQAFRNENWTLVELAKEHGYYPEYANFDSSSDDE